MTPAVITARTDNWLEGSKFSPLFDTGWGNYDLNNPAEIIVDTSPYQGAPDWILDLSNPSFGSATASNATKRIQLLAQAIPSLSTPVGQKPLLSLQQGGRNYNMPDAFVVDKDKWPRGKNLLEVPIWLHSDAKSVAYFYCFGLFDAIIQISNQ